MFDPHRSWHALSMGTALSGLPLPGLLIRCEGAGGDLTLDRLAALVWSSAPRTALEHDIIAVALNDHLVDDGLNAPVATSSDVATP
ncbi:hypothetical protein [Pseudokineococcus marinus]